MISGDVIRPKPKKRLFGRYLEKYKFKTLFAIGFLVTALGLLWVGQGAGYTLWPERSFMLQQTEWIYYGAATAAMGLSLVVFAQVV
jgi:uncharacterized membrane protein